MTDKDVEITVNGKPHSVRVGTTVAQLVERLGLERGQIAVECNREVIVRADYEVVTLTAGDRLEVVAFVGGG